MDYDQESNRIYLREHHRTSWIEFVDIREVGVREFSHAEICDWPHFSHAISLDFHELLMLRDALVARFPIDEYKYIPDYCQGEQ